MARRAIAGLPPQYSKNAGGASASGYWLKLYNVGTTTNKLMWTRELGGVSLAKCKLNTRGEPISNSADDDSVFVPYVDGGYKAALYATEADANADNTANALWVCDNINNQESDGYQTIVSAEFSTVSNMVSGTPINAVGTIDFADYVGRDVHCVWNNSTSKEGGAWYTIWQLSAYRTFIGNPSWVPDGTGAPNYYGGDHYVGGGTTYVAILKHSGVIEAECFGLIADWDKVARTGTEMSGVVQKAIDYAKTYVKTVSGIDPKGGAEVVISGAHGTGMIRMAHSVRIDKSNISLKFRNGASFATDFTGTITNTSDCAVIIVGAAENWLSSGTISSTTKYNVLENIKISRTGGSSPIGILSTGTRNLSVINYHGEQVAAGLYCENTSEMMLRQIATIGCGYGLIGDSRKNRISANSPLGVANIDNDFSASSISMFKAYYPQHTGILLINSGTIGITDATIGRFSPNPSVSPFYGLPTESAGIHYDGGNTNFSKGGSLKNVVFEAAGDGLNKTCILVASRNKNNIVRGLKFENCHVQTYDSNYTTPVLTTLLKTLNTGTGQIDAIIMENCGFTAQTSGYFYPPLVSQSYDVGGLPVAVTLRNCYPAVAYSMSNIGLSYVDGVEYIERTDMEASPEPSGVPSGWALDAGSTVTPNGGSLGNEKYLSFSGNDLATSSMSKTFNFRTRLSRCGQIYVSFWYKGTVAPLLNVRINGQSDTDRTTKSGTNQSRYSSGFYDQPQSTVWRRYVFVFKPYSAGYSFDNVKVTLGRISAPSADYVDIKGVEVGVMPEFSMNYNPFA